MESPINNIQSVSRLEKKLHARFLTMKDQRNLCPKNTQKQLAILDGIKHPEKIEAVGSVLCETGKHRVYLINGSLVVPRHDGDDLVKHQALVDLGGKACRCVIVVNKWPKLACASIPRGLHRKVKECRKLRRKRTPHRYYYSKVAGKLGKDFVTRKGWYGELQRRLALLVLLRCNFKIMKYPEAGLHILVTSHPIARGAVSAHKGDDDKPTTPFGYVTIGVGSYWLKDIYSRGLAMVDGHLIIGWRGYKANGTIRVLLAREFNGGEPYQKYPHIASVAGVLYMKDGKAQELVVLGRGIAHMWLEDV